MVGGVFMNMHLWTNVYTQMNDEDEKLVQIKHNDMQKNMVVFK